MLSSDKLEPFTGHSAFGLVADTSLNPLLNHGGKTLDELLKEAGIDGYTNDFFLGVAHRGLRDRAILTFFREIGGQYSTWQNKALTDAFRCPFYTYEDDRWEGDDRR